VTATSPPDSAVQTTLQARVDGLESQLAVTREQLSDTSKDRDEWREVAKEATSNFKLITNQGSAPKSNDNMMIFVAVAFVVGIGVVYMMLRNDVTPSDAQPEPVVGGIVTEAPFDPEQYFVPRTVCSIYNINPFSKYNDGECAIAAIYAKLGKQTKLTVAEALASRCLNDGLLGDEWIAEKCPEAILEVADIYDVELHPNELSGKPDLEAYGTAVFRSTLDKLRAERKAAEQGADVTGSVTPELQADERQLQEAKP